MKAEIKRLDERKSCGEEQGESENVPVSTKDSRELVVDKMARKIVVKKKLVEQPVPDICGAETDGVAQPVIDRSQKKIVIRRQNVDSSIGSGSGQSTTKLSALERLKSLNFTSKFSFGEKPVVSSNGDQSRLQRSPVGKSRNRSDLVGSVGETELVSTADYRIYPKRPKFEGPQVRGAFPLQVGEEME